MRSDTQGDHLVKVVTFADDMQADQFESYWKQRRRWLGLLNLRTCAQSRHNPLKSFIRTLATSRDLTCDT